MQQSFRNTAIMSIHKLPYLTKPQPSRDHLLHQATISFLRLDRPTICLKPSNRELKPTKCRKRLWPCLFNMDHFPDRSPQPPNLLSGSKVSHDTRGMVLSHLDGAEDGRTKVSDSYSVQYKIMPIPENNNYVRY